MMTTLHPGTRKLLDAIASGAEKAVVEGPQPVGAEVVLADGDGPVGDRIHTACAELRAEANAVDANSQTPVPSVLAQLEVAVVAGYEREYQRMAASRLDLFLRSRLRKTGTAGFTRYGMPAGMVR